MKLSMKHAFLLSAIAMAAYADEAADDAVLPTEVGNVESLETNDLTATLPSELGEMESIEEIEVTADAADTKECTTEDEECKAPPAEEEETTTTEAVTESATAEEEDPSCPSRPHVIRCAAKYLDTNQNGQLEKAELETAMNAVPWILRSLLNIIGSIDAIMKKCDADGDGAIDIEGDMKATEETCLATCFKRKAFKRLFFPDCTE